MKSISHRRRWWNIATDNTAQTEVRSIDSSWPAMGTDCVLAVSRVIAHPRAPLGTPFPKIAAQEPSAIVVKLIAEGSGVDVFSGSVVNLNSLKG